VNVEVEVVREVRTTYLVLGAASLESAEEEAVKCAHMNVSSTVCVKQGKNQTRDVYAAWSEPVIVKNGKVQR
jgi:hypothetical protein